MKTLTIAGVLLLLIGAAGMTLYLKHQRAAIGTTLDADSSPVPTHKPSGNGSAEPEAAIVVLSGTIMVTLPSGEQKTLADETRVPVGTRITTASASRARVEFPDGSKGHLEEQTEIILLKLEARPSTAVSVRLTGGRIFSRVKQLFTGSRYEIRTSNTLAAVRGTGFDVSFRRGKSRIITLEDKVEVTALDPKTEEPIAGVPTVIVEEKRSVTLDEAAPPTPAEPPKAELIDIKAIQTDPWLIFNIETAIQAGEPLPLVPGFTQPKEPIPSPESQAAAPVPEPSPTPRPTALPSPSPTLVPTISPIAIQTTIPSPSPTPTPSPTAPKLAITQVSPETADPRFADFPFRIFGTGFETGASAFIGSSPLKNVTTISPTEINALIPSGTPPASYDVIVVNPNGGRAVLGGGVFAVAEFQ